MIYPPIHCAAYGQMGKGKTMFAASFPKPMLVWCFDGLGKDWWYFYDYYNEGKARGIISEMHYEVGHMWREVRSAKDNRLLVRVRYFYENDEFELGRVQLNQKSAAIHTLIEKPDLSRRFFEYLSQCRDEVKEFEKANGTLVVDSTTFMEMAFRYYHRYVLNSEASGEGKKQWWSGSTDDLEAVISRRLMKWNMNVVCISHVGSDKEKGGGEDGGAVLKYRPNLPGRMAEGIQQAMQEVYRAYRTPEGVHLLQTQEGGKFDASSHINAPNPCRPHYKSLWANFKGASSPEQAGGESVPGETDAKAEG